jgi:hypothetical protein
MITLSATLVLRPTRIGFLIEPHDAASLHRIFQTCSCLWGGVYNPIIPVCNALPEVWKDLPPALDPRPTDLAKGYVDFFEPDVFVEAQQGLAASVGITVSDLGFGDPRVVSLDTFCETGNRHGSDVPFGTNGFSSTNICMSVNSSLFLDTSAELRSWRVTPLMPLSLKRASADFQQAVHLRLFRRLMLTPSIPSSSRQVPKIGSR